MGRRKRSSWGTLDEVRRGVWRIRWREDAPEGRVRRSETFHGTRREAERRLAEIRVATKEEPSPLVGWVWARYVLPRLRAEVERGSRSEQTLGQYESTWRRHVGPRFGGVPVAKLSPLEVQDWLLGLSASTGAQCLKVLRLVSATALKLRVIDADYLRCDFTLAPARRRARDVPTQAELAGVWEALRGTWVEPAFLLCAHAGLRAGEAAGLRVADLEWRDVEGLGPVCVAHVHAQLSQRGAYRAPKTRTGHRYAVMLEPWASRLREIVGGLRPDAVWVMDDGASEPDEAPSRDRLQTQLRRALAGTPHEGLTLQRCRPAYETYMRWERGVPIEHLARLMGHTSISTTAENYDRPSNATVLDAILGDLAS